MGDLGECTDVGPDRAVWGPLLLVGTVVLAVLLLRWAAQVDVESYPKRPRSGQGMFYVAAAVACLPAVVAARLDRGAVRWIALALCSAVVSFSVVAESVVNAGGVRIPL